MRSPRRRADRRDPALIAAKQALDPLALYPAPVSIDRVRVVVAPWLFRLPVLRRFDGYATWRVIFVRRPVDRDPRLVVHELCHVWQMQHHPIRMPMSYLRGYHSNRFELEARQAAADAHVR